jgi:DNA-binding CsgD family transcriptional regulator
MKVQVGHSGRSARRALSAARSRDQRRPAGTSRELDGRVVPSPGRAQTHGVAPQLPILDREHEIAVITEVVDDAVHGHGRFLVIEGDAGIGKTRLLEHARTLAAERGLRVLSARGSELESEFAFGIVRQLFEAQVASPPDRVALLSGSAAGAAPVFESTIEPVRWAELPILHGLYWLTVNLNQRSGVLLIDDLHWADAASLRYLAYLVPRLTELPLLVVAVIRSGEAGSDEVLLRTLLADGAVTALRPGPLSEPAVRELLRTLLDDDVDPAFAAYCAAATAGNPLLLRALAATLARDGVAPTMANQERVTELGRVAVSHLVTSRLARLAEPARVVARAAAVLGSGAELPAVARLAGVDLLTATDAADELTRLGLLDGQTLSFVHPVVGAAIYAELGSRDRLLIHARAADVLDELGEEPERVAAHLLKTVPGVGTDVVGRLRRAAVVALCRGSPDAAFAYLRRCLAEDLDPAQRFALLREAATVAVKVDLHEAVRLFEDAKRYAAAPADRARILAQLGVAYGYLLDPDRAVEAFYGALRLLPESEDDERRRIEATLLVAVFVAPGRREITDRLGGLKRLPAADGLGARMLEAAIAGHEMAVCDPRGHARARAALADGLLVRAANGEGAVVCGWLTLLAADDPAGLASLEDAVGQAHLHGSLRALAPAYTFRALGRLWTGQLVEAETDAREALRLAETGRVDMDPVFAASYLADALIEQGRLDEAEALLERFGVRADPTPARPRYYAMEAYARLIRRRGDRDAASVALTAGQLWQAYGYDNPALGSWRTDAALALFASDDVPSARRLAAEELQRAERWGAPRAYGRALRVVGQVTGGTGGLALLQQSVEMLAGSAARLEYARSLAELGAALRRAGRRTEAREALGRALEAAEVCGAAPLVAQVMTESHAAGYRPRRHRLVGVDALTPSERRVAEIAAGGASNREIAQALFVTTKTVEVHLTSAYRKLGVSRRGELGARLG